MAKCRTAAELCPHARPTEEYFLRSRGVWYVDDWLERFGDASKFLTYAHPTGLSLSEDCLLRPMPEGESEASEVRRGEKGNIWLCASSLLCEAGARRVVGRGGDFRMRRKFRKSRVFGPRRLGSAMARRAMPAGPILVQVRGRRPQFTTVSALSVQLQTTFRNRGKRPTLTSLRTRRALTPGTYLGCRPKGRTLSRLSEFSHNFRVASTSL